MYTPPAAIDHRNWHRTRVLVLNATSQALCEVPAERAVGLVAIGAADSLADHAPAVPIRSQYLTVPLPETVRLREYVYVPRTDAEHGRTTYAGVLRRDRNTCGYCAARTAAAVDHVVPIGRGGTHGWANLVACCAPCARRKADRTPEEAGMTLLWQPTVPTHIDRAQHRIRRRLATIGHGTAAARRDGAPDRGRAHRTSVSSTAA